MTRDPLLNPLPGDRFRHRSGVEVEWRAADGRLGMLVDADGIRHPFSHAVALRAALLGATVIRRGDSAPVENG